MLLTRDAFLAMAGTSPWAMTVPERVGTERSLQRPVFFARAIPENRLASHRSSHRRGEDKGKSAASYGVSSECILGP